MVNIRRVHYNNKSRQGYYYYIKETGKRPRILKAYPGLTKEFYEYAHENKLNWRELHNASKIFSDMKRKRKITLNTQIKRGVTEVTTTLQTLSTEQGRRQTYDKLIEPLLKNVTNPQLKKLIKQNISKHPHKFSYHISGIVKEGSQGKTGMEIIDIGNKNLEDLNNVYVRKIGLYGGKTVSNDMQQEISQDAGIPTTNVKIKETGKKLIEIRVRVRFIQ